MSEKDKDDFKFSSTTKYRTDKFFVFVYFLVGVVLVLQFLLMFGAELL